LISFVARARQREREGERTARTKSCTQVRGGKNRAALRTSRRRDAVAHGRRDPAFDSVHVGFVERRRSRLLTAAADSEAAHEVADGAAAL